MEVGKNLRTLISLVVTLSDSGAECKDKAVTGWTVLNKTVCLSNIVGSTRTYLPEFS